MQEIKDGPRTLRIVVCFEPGTNSYSFLIKRFVRRFVRRKVHSLNMAHKKLNDDSCNFVTERTAHLWTKPSFISRFSAK